MVECRRCTAPVEPSFRYCPWCAAPQRLKITDFFRPHPLVEGGTDRALRVSRYLGIEEDERHVRFSVWDPIDCGRSRAESAISLPEAEAGRLARFLVELPADAPAESERVKP
jgi:hypothetical protein